MNVVPVCLSTNGYIKIYHVAWSEGNDVATHNGAVSYELLSRSCFYCPNLITVAPL